MELREFIKVFADRKNLFFWVLLGFVVLALLYFRFQPARYEAALMLNVARTGFLETSDYQFDQFYRLQADERFADTVVRWLGAPSLRSDIVKESGASKAVIGTISARRLSSQMIDVRYHATSPKDLSGIDTAIVSTLNRETGKLNESAQDPSWFVLMADQPIVSDTRISFGKSLAAGIAAGIFFAFWAVLLLWYWFGGNSKSKAPSSK